LQTAHTPLAAAVYSIHTAVGNGALNKSVSYAAVNFLNPEVIFLYCQLRYECSATLGTAWQCLSRLFSTGSISLYSTFTGWLVYLDPLTCIQITLVQQPPTSSFYQLTHTHNYFGFFLERLAFLPSVKGAWELGHSLSMLHLPIGHISDCEAQKASLT
jgi:hypothetical protein